MLTFGCDEPRYARGYGTVAACGQYAVDYLIGNIGRVPLEHIRSGSSLRVLTGTHCCYRPSATFVQQQQQAFPALLLFGCLINEGFSIICVTSC